jgi:hypothetical protein
MFVIDRSGSMVRTFNGGPTKWDALRRGLAASLPAVDQTMAIGAYLFPLASPAGSGSCAAPGVAALMPATGNVSTLVDLLARNTPGGGTPTAEAVDLAAATLRGVRAARSARALVLATDGAPGCNTSLDRFTCVCGDPVLPGQVCGVNNCLDDTRTLARMSAITDGGLPTWVIGIQDTTDAVLVDVLDRMAVAGGRPRPTSPRYYPANSSSELEQALVSIRDQVGGCTFLTASVPDAQGNIRVLVDGVQVPEDPTGVEGWSWADRDNGELVFSGQACVRATQDVVVTANVGCSVDAGR